MKELLKQLERANSTDKKIEIEILLSKAYTSICDLRKQTLTKTLTLESIEEIEFFFQNNQLNIETLNFENRYFLKYAKCLSFFWESYTYYGEGQRSKGKFDLFKSLKENDLVLNIHHSESACANVLRKMENYWMASNQIYTKYQIDLINKEYVR